MQGGFGQPPGGGGFGQPPGGGGFGQPPGGGGFGTPAPQQGGFGTPAPQQGGFGAPAPQQGGFGTPAPQQGGFGSPAPQQGGFGAPPPGGFGSQGGGSGFGPPPSGGPSVGAPPPAPGAPPPGGEGEPNNIGLILAALWLALGMLGCLGTGAAAVFASESAAVNVSYLGVPMFFAGTSAMLVAPFLRTKGAPLAIGAPVGCGCLGFLGSAAVVGLFYAMIWPSL
jgi:hypothetical protein